MKALFFVFHELHETHGVSKKIQYQVKALSACGIDTKLCCYEVSYQGNRRCILDNKVLADFGAGFYANIKKRIYFSHIESYIKNENIDFVYIRSHHNANPWTIHFVKKIKRYGTKVVLEIPTFPYDEEYITLRMQLDLAVDRLFRCQLARHLDRIVTFSNATTIWGTPTIRISNGIDFDAISVKRNHNTRHDELHLIGVAQVAFWHGFDRLIKGLANYYATERDCQVYFHLVGQMNSPREQQDILSGIHENGLESYVLLYGNRHGNELDELFEKADMAIGSLGRHRSNITCVKTLKNREYAARGLAFAYSETDDDFDEKPYVLKVPADETPIDIQTIIDFYRRQTYSAEEIRASIVNLSWKVQMKQVVEQVYMAPALDLT